MRKWAILFLVDACSLLIPPKRSAPEHLPERWYFRAAQLRLLWVITECIFQFLIINSVQTCCSQLPYKLQSHSRKGHHRLTYLPASQQIYVMGLICTPKQHEGTTARFLIEAQHRQPNLLSVKNLQWYILLRHTSILLNRPFCENLSKSGPLSLMAKICAKLAFFKWNQLD